MMRRAVSSTSDGVRASAFWASTSAISGVCAHEVIRTPSSRLAEFVQCADAVIDTVGGPTQDQLFALAKLGGIVVSAVSPPNDRWAEEYRVRSDYFIVDVNSTRLDAKELAASVGTILPLA